MADFRTGNLVADPLADGILTDMDLILCRNVLIYFHPDAIRIVADKLAASLGEGGYLVAGHTELHGCLLRGLQRNLAPQGLVYERAAHPPSLVVSPPPVVVAPPPVATLPPSAAPPFRDAADLENAQALADRGHYQAAEDASRQAAAASETASTIEELSASSRQSAEQAANAAVLAGDASRNTGEGSATTGKTIVAMSTGHSALAGRPANPAARCATSGSIFPPWHGGSWPNWRAANQPGK